MKIFSSTSLLWLCLALPAHAELSLSPAITSEEAKLLEDAQVRLRKAGAPAMTDEQRAMFIQQLRNTRIRMLGVEAGVQTMAQSLRNQPPSRNAASPARTAPEPMQEIAPRTSTNLASEFDKRNKASRFTRFERRKDGFSYDGSPFIDSEGPIGTYGADSRSGGVVYLVDTSASEAVVKYHNVHSPLPAIAIGTATDSAGRITFQTATGEKISGDALLPTARGVIMLREQGLISYDIKDGTVTRAIPDGYVVAPMQAGAVAETGYVLLERVAPAESASPLSKLISAGKAIQSELGRDSSQDYALYNLRSQRLVALNIPLRGKTVGEGVGCEARSALVNKCRGWKTYSSIWEADGSPNWRHYFWAASWHMTSHGPMAIVMENGSKEINVIKLDTGERVNAFNRALGIASYNVAPTPGGSLRVDASWAFKKHEVPDVAELFEAAK